MTKPVRQLEWLEKGSLREKWLGTRKQGNQSPDNEGLVLTNLSLDFTLEAMYKHQKNLRKGVIITFAFLERSQSNIAANKIRPYETNQENHGNDPKKRQ